MSNTFASGDIKVDENNVPYMNKKPVEKMVHVLHQHFSALEVGTKYTCLFSTDERHMVNGINNLYGTDFTWNKLDSKTHEFFNPVAAQPFTRLKFSHVGDFYVAQVVVDPNLQIEGAKPSTEIGEMLSKDTRPKFDTAYFASRDKLSILTSFIHTSFSTRHMSFSPSRDIDSAFLALGEDKFLTPVVLNNYRNNGGYSTLLFKNEVLPAIELDINVYSKARVAVVLGSKLGLSLTEDNFVSDDLIHAFDPYTGVNEEYTIFRLTRGEEVKYMAAVTAVDIIVKPTDPIDPTDPVEPVDPETPVDKPLTDLSLVTNNDMPGVWKAEVDKYSDLDEEGNTVGNDILESVLAAINLVSDTTIGFEDLSMILGDDYRITVTAATGRPIAKVKGKLVVAITEKVITPPEEPSNYGPTGLKADYSGTGWYKATDTGTVFCKDVPALETMVFEEGGLEYVSVYTKEDAKLYGARAATSNLTDASYMFNSNSTFNEDIGSWDTSNVTNMNSLFDGATAFNQDLSSWDVSNVTSMNGMFRGCSKFNGDISNWNTSNVTEMTSTFESCSAFNQPLGEWNVSNVSSMKTLFLLCLTFNQDISTWDTGNVENMNAVFYGAKQFNQPIGTWNVGKVNTMETMFDGATAFNQDISSWDVSNVTNMGRMFFRATTFNQDLSLWCVPLIPTKPDWFDGANSGVWVLPRPVWGTCPRGEDGSVPETPEEPVEYGPTGLRADYSGSGWYKATDTGTVFCKGVPALDTCVFEVDGLEYVSVYTAEDAKLYGARASTSNVTNMSSMFHNDKSFNQDISSWDVSNVTNMTSMFSGALGFNWDLSEWCVSKIPSLPTTFAVNSALELVNYPVWGTCPRHEDGSVPEEPVSQVDLSQITNHDVPGEWYVEVASNEEREAEYDNVIASVLVAINAGSEQNVTLEDLVIYTDSSNNTFVASVTEDDAGKVIGTLVVKIKVVIQEEPSNYGPTGLRANYPGTGWYKATDTGTVFCKDVPALETQVFEEGGLEYICVHTKEDAKLYGERAAVSNITDMSYMFQNDTSFNSDISSWDVSNVVNMRSMFNSATSFNQDISNWDVSNVANMWSMFNNATSFNQDISNWNTGRVTNMSSIFARASSFNQDISNWDVSNVVSMSSMFNNATSFNQDLGKWCVSFIPTKPSNFDLSATTWNKPRPVWGTCPES